MEKGLAGVWRLKEAVARGPNGDLLDPPYGPEPMGVIVFEPGGRMISVVCDGRAAAPERGARAYASYCGAYSVEGGRVTTIIDAAADPARIGSAQTRLFELDGDSLILRPPRRASGEQRELTWERIG